MNSKSLPLARRTVAAAGVTMAAVSGMAPSGDANAAVMVDFTAFGAGATQNFGEIAGVSNPQVLTFDVAANGDVTLDFDVSGNAASQARADLIGGSVGTVSATGSAFSFTITMTAIGLDGVGGGVTLNPGTGAAVQGSVITAISFPNISATSQALVFAVDMAGVDPNLEFQLEGLTTISSATGTPGPQLVDFSGNGSALTIGANAIVGGDTALAGGSSDSFAVDNTAQGGGNATGFSLGSISFDVAVVPEPGSLALAGCALAFIGLRRR